MTPQFRQGDVLLRAVQMMPEQVFPVPSRGDRVVLAEGELTGHAHAFAAAEARLFREEESERLFLAVGKDGATLRHEEHAPIPVPRGYCEVLRQREYTPGKVRPVAD